jgi:hypothetical protein
MTVITKTGLGKNDISKILSASLILIILLFNASFIYSALDGIPLNKERIIIVKSLLLIFNVLLIIFNFNFEKYPCKLQLISILFSTKKGKRDINSLLINKFNASLVEFINTFELNNINNSNIIKVIIKNKFFFLII